MNINKETTSVRFRSVQKEDLPSIANMMRDLYASLGVEETYMGPEKIAATFAYLFSPQNHLHLDVFEVQGKMAGYALNFDFWYNELGGKVLQVDELYVLPIFRGQGIASQYLEILSIRTDYMALMLEVLPNNTKAMEVYKRAGFEPKETRTLYKLCSGRSDLRC